MLTCIKQHLSNIWNSIHEKVKQQWGNWKKQHWKKAIKKPIQRKTFIMKSSGYFTRNLKKDQYDHFYQ